jgi:hypothetical protein
LVSNLNYLHMKTALRSFTLILVSSFLLASHQASAQCNSALALFQTNTACFGEDLQFTGYVTSDCQVPNSVQYTWTSSGIDTENNPVIYDQLTVTGNVPGYTLIPLYTIPYNDILEIYQICLDVNILDENLSVISTTQQCLSSFDIPTVMTVLPQLSPNWCGDQVCLMSATVVGGIAPYAYYVDGEPASSNFGLCYNSPGMHEITVVDANGCVTNESFMVATSELGNGSCESAQPLQSGIVFQDTLCTINFENTSCLDYSYYLESWYTINSENAAHMNIGFFSGYYGNNGFMPFGLEVYTSPDNSGCGNLELAYCYDGQLNGSCFDLAEFIAIAPNTDYYIRPVVQWTSMSYCEIVVVLSDELIDPICGCNNPASCNYNPEALINDGSCGYNGCMDPGACNYLSYASCDDGSCIYGNDMTGQVFHDLNGNGLWDFWSNEAAMGTGGYLYISELNMIVYPDGEGSFVLPDLPANLYHVEYVSTDALWVLSGDNTLEITLPTCNGLLIPVVPTSEAAAQISGDGFWWNTNLHCTNGFNIGVWVQNTGTVPLSGEFSMSFDPSLNYAEYSYGVSPTVNNAGNPVWQITDQPVGTTMYYMIHILGPGVEEVGNVYSFAMNLALEDNQGFVFYDESWTNNSTVTCAYDPNDKQAIPVGYADQHFILGNEEIEYKIRFQNTGNAPAFDVVIEDQIDITKLDLGTIEPVIASHSCSTIIQPDGLVKFVFNNIMLPDSASDEPGSQGYVIFRIRPVEGLLPGDVIENTAGIFFDENPPIITNTTFHTIFSCDWIQPDPQSTSVCEGDTVGFDATYDYVDAYVWLLEDMMIWDGSVLDYALQDQGTYSFSLQRSNPLCDAIDEFEVVVHPNPEATITSDGTIMTASDGIAWQWFYLSVPLVEQTSQTANIIGDGFYHVEVTNEHGCTAQSEPFMVVTAGESLYDTPSVLFPNPAHEFALLKTSQKGSSMSVYDQQGRMVYSGNVNSDFYHMNTSEFNAGIYTVVLHSPGKTEKIRLIVE